MAQPAAPKPYCYILELPVEILEGIFSFLLPSAARRRYWPKNLDDEMPRPESWRPECKALRLTCQRFNQVRPLSAALFHDFYLYPIGFSLQNLKELSESELAQHVRRVVFMRPQFSTEYCDRDTYYDTLAVSLEIPNRADNLQDGDVFISGLALSRRYLFEIYTQEDLRAGHEQYMIGLNEQQEVFSSGKYIGLGATLFPRFPRITSVVICGGNGNVDGISRNAYHNWSSDTCETFLERRYPLTRMKTGYDFYGGDFSGEFFVHRVFRVLSLARMKPLELACTQGVMITPALKLYHLSDGFGSPNFGRLRSVDLTLSTSEDSNISFGLSDTVPAIVDAAKTSLEKLIIRASPQEQRVARHIMSIVFNFSFSSLKEVHLRMPSLSAHLLVSFLQRHPNLTKVELRELHFDQASWRLLFKALRVHKLQWIRIHGIMKREQGVNPPKIRAFRISTAEKCGGGSRTAALSGLESFLRGEGDWGTDMVDIFGPMESTTEVVS